MLKEQTKVIESCAQVLVFADEHLPSGPPEYASARAMLEDAMQKAREYASVQLSGPALSRAELRRQQQLIRRLTDRFMRPIVTIARSQAEPGADDPMSAALRMPRSRLSVTKVLQAADGMIEAATPFVSVLVANGLPADVLDRFREARNELLAVPGQRALLTLSHVGARQGLKVQLRRARLAVHRLDAIVRVAFEGNEAVLAEWRKAKRVHQLPGPRRGLSLVEEVPSAETPEVVGEAATAERLAA